MVCPPDRPTFLGQDKTYEVMQIDGSSSKGIIMLLDVYHKYAVTTWNFYTSEILLQLEHTEMEQPCVKYNIVNRLAVK